MFIVGFILIAALAYIIFKKAGASGMSNAESPLELLQKRFVNGEISRDEYLEKKDTLKK